jgi:hypothetical protein
MKITIEEKIRKETWEMLKQIKRDIFLTAKNHYVNYEVKEDKENSEYPLPDDQRKIIGKMESDGILKIYKKNFFSSTSSIYDSTTLEIFQQVKPKGYLLDINEPKFEQYYSEYERKYGDVNMPEYKKGNNLYIEKRNDDFFYNGKRIETSTDSNAYKVFCALHALLPQGGEVNYGELNNEIKSRISETKNYSAPEIRKFILTNLTDRNNGFMHHIGSPLNESNGKPLLSAKRGKGIIFNNRKG